jgi:hypothetical protein
MAIRYSTRSLLVLMLSVGLVLGVWQSWRNKYVLQEQVIAALEEQGAIQVYYSQRLTGWLYLLSLGSRRSCDCDLKIYSASPEVIRQLKFIDIDDVTLLCQEFGDRELASLIDSAPELYSLKVRRSSISDRGVGVLKKCWRTLRVVALGELFFHPDGIAKQDYRWWRYPQNQFTDEAFRQLAGISLSRLMIVSNGLDDSNLQGLAELRHVLNLQIISDQLDDDCVPQLSSYPRSSSLLVSQGKLSPQKIKQLEANHTSIWMGSESTLSFEKLDRNTAYLRNPDPPPSSNDE